MRPSASKVSLAGSSTSPTATTRSPRMPTSPWRARGSGAIDDRSSPDQVVEHAPSSVVTETSHANHGRLSIGSQEQSSLACALLAAGSDGPDRDPRSRIVTRQRCHTAVDEVAAAGKMAAGAACSSRRSGGGFASIMCGDSAIADALTCSRPTLPRPSTYQRRLAAWIRASCRPDRSPRSAPRPIRRVSGAGCSPTWPAPSVAPCTRSTPRRVRGPGSRRLPFGDGPARVPSIWWSSMCPCPICPGGHRGMRDQGGQEEPS